MLNLVEMLNFLSENKHLFLIFIVVGLILHLWGMFYIGEHRKEDFSYSGHVYVWYEGSPFLVFLAYMVWIFGALVVMGSFLLFTATT